MTSRKTAQTTAQPPEGSAGLPASFEEAMAELEGLVKSMDSDQLGLDQLLTQYRRGADLVRYCRDRLSQVRGEVARIEAGLLDQPGSGDGALS
ncbi:MAG: exodeoxyribonuclease VII small subunit [Limnobacter sp.]|uniref:exodeoxyribonuclease VII small subunit n=1 Tax=Limnobacter sp. TaxID=2003368 RepID=UPI00391CE63B